MSELVAELPLLDDMEADFATEQDLAPVAEAHEFPEFAGIAQEVGRVTLKPLSGDLGNLSRQFIPPTGKATPAAFNSVFEETPAAFQSFV